jgi:hydrogenase maturation protease
VNTHLLDRIARAVLYEGYILYPYRPDSPKNRQRWTFGGIYPRAYSESHRNSDAWFMQTQCLVTGDGQTAVEIQVRFLHLLARTVYESTNGQLHPVESLQVGERLYQTWQEAMERDIRLGEFALADLITQPVRREFTFDTEHEVEPLPDGAGELTRERQAIRGTIEVSAEAKEAGAFVLTVKIINDTALENAAVSRDEASLRALVSTHMILGVSRGAFVSMTDPPEALRPIAVQCRNIGAWPVLVGSPGQTDTLLSSPIILPDYPEVAPESPGDLFDATEIDEILTLRILTLTDEEKRQMAAVDQRARDLLERTERLDPRQLMNLHGALRRGGP